MAVGEQGIYADDVRACREHAELSWQLESRASTQIM